MAAETQSMNQIFQKYVKPNAPGYSIGDWLQFIRKTHAAYVDKGGHLTLEQYALKHSVAMNSRMNQKNVEGENTPETQTDDKSGKFADTSFWSRYKKPIVWTILGGSILLVGYAIVKDNK